ncbi:hypothetical protein DSM07_05910 [Oenococcus sp. UCMA 16435]|nr:hypothetical protein DSM07_05910 [Oenococcus sp. UCMA 16435]
MVEYRKIWKISKTPESIDVINAVCSSGLKKEDLLAKTKTFAFLKKQKLVKSNPPLDTHINPRTYYFIEGLVGNPDKAFVSLDRQRVCIVGLGGIGGSILQHLCGSHISRFLLVDFDRVEDNNLNRQYLYSKDDIGKYKTDVCREYVNKHADYPNNVSVFRARIETATQLIKIAKSFDPTLIVCAADKPYNISRIVGTAASTLKSKAIQGGVGPDFASYSFYDKPTAGTFTQVPRKSRNTTVIHERQVSYGSFGPTNSILAAMMSNDIVMSVIKGKCFGQVSGRKNVLDFRRFSFESI